MEKVKCYLPGIKVKCISEYCRKGAIVTIIDKSEGYEAVDIRYEDGSTDTGRIGHNDEYDFEFVDSQDELLQIAMEKYKGKSFTSLVGTSCENFQPVSATWHHDGKYDIIISDISKHAAVVYRKGEWAKIQGEPKMHEPAFQKGEFVTIVQAGDRNDNAYCNVMPDADYYIHQAGLTVETSGSHKILNIIWNSYHATFFYQLENENDDHKGWWSEESLKPAVEQEALDETFPVEGQCKSITLDLVAYLRNTRTPEGDQSQKEKAKAICWNHKGYWYVSRSSQKQEYSINYLRQFFTHSPEQPKMEPQQQFDYTPQGGFQLTLPPEIVGAALSQATQTHFRESEKKFEKHRNDVIALVDQKKQMIETELYQKFEKTIGCEFVEFKQKVVEDYLTSKQVVIELGQEKKYEFSLDDKHEQLPKMVTFLQLFKQAMIVGPSGSGKSTMAKQAADVMGLRYGSFSCNLEASKSELVGFANIDGYVESSFLDFYENGGVFLIDEYDSMSPSIAVVLNAAFDRTGILAVPNRKGKTIAKKHKDFYCILAGNTWGSGSVEYQGREMQDAAFLDRFKMCRIFIDYDPQLEKNIAGKYYKFFTKVRNYVTKKVDGENFSTRSIYDATMLLQNGFKEQDILTMMSEHWDEALRKDLFKTVGYEFPVAA